MAVFCGKFGYGISIYMTGLLPLAGPGQSPGLPSMGQPIRPLVLLRRPAGPAHDGKQGQGRQRCPGHQQEIVVVGDDQRLAVDHLVEQRRPLSAAGVEQPGGGGGAVQQRVERRRDGGQRFVDDLGAAGQRERGDGK